MEAKETANVGYREDTETVPNQLVYHNNLYDAFLFSSKTEMDINYDQEKDVRKANLASNVSCLPAIHQEPPSIDCSGNYEDPNQLVEQNVLYEATPINDKPVITQEKELLNDRLLRSTHHKPQFRYEPDYDVLEGPDPNAAYESISDVIPSSPVYDELSKTNRELMPQKEPLSLYNVLKRSTDKD